MATEEFVLNFGEKGGAQLEGMVKKVTRSIAEMQRIAAKQFSVGGGGSVKGPLGNSADIDKMGRSLNRVGQEVRNTTAHFSLFGRIVASVAVTKFARDLINLSDTYQNLQNQIKTVTQSQGEQMFVSQQLLQIANDSRTSLEGVATVYTRTARSVKGLGVTQQETLQFTETLTKAIAVGGSTSVEASNAMIQLSQGLSSGTLKGDELRSVLEQLPVVAQLIADKMGVHVGALRKLGAEGKLTTKIVFDAIREGTLNVEERFAKMTPTISQAWEVMKNNALASMKSIEGAAGKFANFILLLAKNFDVVTESVVALAQVITVALVGRAMGALRAAFIALNASNPWLAIISGAALAIAAIIPFSDRIKLSAKDSTTLRDVWDEFLSTSGELLKRFGTFIEEYMLKPLGLVEISLETIIMGVAKALDFYNNLAQRAAVGVQNFASASTPGGIAGPMPTVIGGGSTIDKEYNQRGAREFLERARIRGEERRLEAQVKAGADDTDKLIAEIESRRREPATVKAASTAKSSGNSIDDLIRELNDGLTVLRTAENENTTVMKRLEATMDRLGKGHSASGYGTKKDAFFEPSIRSSNFLSDYENKGIIPAMGSNPGGSGLTPQNKFQEVEDRIRQQEGIIQGKKEQERLEQLSTKRIDEQLKDEMALMAAEAERLRKQKEADAVITASLDPMKEYNEEYRKLQDYVQRHPQDLDKVNQKMQTMTLGYKTLAPLAEQFNQSVADAVANAIAFGDSMEKSLEQIAKAMEQQLISKAIQLGVNALAGAITGTSVGDAPFSATPITVGGGSSASGGYTGDGPAHKIAGVYHGQEFVVNKNATNQFRPMLEAMNSGQAPRGNAAPNIQVHNYAGVEVEVQSSPSFEEVQVMIKRGVEKHAPGVVAGNMRDPNSAVSKAVVRHNDTRRKN